MFHRYVHIKQEFPLFTMLILSFSNMSFCFSLLNHSNENKAIRNNIISHENKSGDPFSMPYLHSDLHRGHASEWYFSGHQLPDQDSKAPHVC